jgi:hypothetical protein
MRATVPWQFALGESIDGKLERMVRDPDARSTINSYFSVLVQGTWGIQNALSYAIALRWPLRVIRLLVEEGGAVPCEFALVQAFRLNGLNVMSEVVDYLHEYCGVRYETVSYATMHLNHLPIESERWFRFLMQYRCFWREWKTHSTLGYDMRILHRVRRHVQRRMCIILAITQRRPGLLSRDVATLIYKSMMQSDYLYEENKSLPRQQMTPLDPFTYVMDFILELPILLVLALVKLFYLVKRAFFSS